MEKLIKDGYVKLAKDNAEVLNFIRKNKGKNNKSNKALYKNDFPNNIKNFFLTLNI